MEGLWIPGSESGPGRSRLSSSNISIKQAAGAAGSSELKVPWGEERPDFRNDDARLFGLNAAVVEGWFDTAHDRGSVTEMGKPGSSVRGFHRRLLWTIIIGSTEHGLAAIRGSGRASPRPSLRKWRHRKAARQGFLSPRTMDPARRPRRRAGAERESHQQVRLKYWEIGHGNTSSWRPYSNTRPHDHYVLRQRFATLL